LVHIWLFKHYARELKVEKSYVALQYGGWLLLGWLILFSRLRWRTRLLWVGALCAGRLVQIWFLRESYRQLNFEDSYAVLQFAALVLLAWLVVFSNLRWRTRLLWVAGLAALCGLAVALVRVRGITGDRLPLFAWRWAPRPGEPVSQSATVPPERRVGAPVTTNLASFPQFLGPGRDGVLSGPKLDRDWQTRKPELLWRHAVGAGWAGFAVQDGKAVTLEQSGANEEVVCYDLFDGRRLWTHAYPARYEDPDAGVGPRSVPTVAAGRIYTTGGTGILTCVDFGTGQKVWSCDLMQQHGSSVPRYGFSASPLVRGREVIVTPGGAKQRSLAAHDAETGGFLWGGGTNAAGYSSPIFAQLLDTEQILVFNANALAGHDSHTGALLWEYAIPSVAHVANPLVISSNQVLASCGYGQGSFLVAVAREDSEHWSVKLLWKSIRLKSKFANLLVRGGYLYGLDDGMLTCLELTSGERRWKETRYGHGQLLLVNDLLLVTAENGEVALVELSPEKPVELTRFQALKGKTWNPPTLANDLLLVRNDVEAACYRLPTVP
jgi:outer membrane protein assembly factor BamB